MLKKSLLIISYLFLSQMTNAQVITDFFDRGFKNNDIVEKLPPLDTLVYWARQNNPYLKSFESTKELGEGKVILEKRSWLQYFSVDAGYGYGVYDNLSNQQIAGDPGNQTLFSSQQSRYNFGGSIKMPLSALVNRKRNIKNTKLEAEKFKYEQQQALNELSLQVTIEYNDVIKFYRMLFISSSVLDTYRAQTLRAEKEFADGVINVSDYTRLLNMITQARMGLEQQKAEFFKSFMALESTVGVDLKL